MNNKVYIVFKYSIEEGHHLVFIERVCSTRDGAMAHLHTVRKDTDPRLAWAVEEYEVDD